MSTQEILAELPRLPAEDRELIARTLRDLEANQPASPLPGVSKQRTAGLHEGAWIIADDFDDPLPDEFWLGEDA